MGTKLIDDMPSLRKRLAGQEERRLQRLREAKDAKSIRRLVENLASKELSPKILTDAQRMAIYYMTDFVHNFSYKWIAAKLNIEPSVLAQWRNDPLFLREVDKEITRRRNFMRLHAFRNVFRDINRGNTKVSLQYLKMTGDLKENVNIMEDNSGEKELDDEQLNEQIEGLTKSLAKANTPSDN